MHGPMNIKCLTTYQKLTVITAIGKLPLLRIPRTSHSSNYFFFYRNIPGIL